MPIEQLSAGDWPLAHMTGTGAVSLSDARIDALRKYVQAGGTLVIDAAGGDKEFQASARKIVEQAFGASALKPVPSASPLYSAGGTLEKVTYRRAARLGVGEGNTAPRLQGVEINGRLAVIYSAEDITCGLLGYPCYGLDGYTPQSAYELMRNIVLYAGKKP